MRSHHFCGYRCSTDESISGWLNENWACNDFIHGVAEYHMIHDGGAKYVFITNENCKISLKCFLKVPNRWQLGRMQGTYKKIWESFFFFLVESDLTRPGDDFCIVSLFPHVQFFSHHRQQINWKTGNMDPCIGIWGCHNLVVTVSTLLSVTYFFQFGTLICPMFGFIDEANDD